MLPDKKATHRHLQLDRTTPAPCPPPSLICTAPARISTTQYRGGFTATYDGKEADPSPLVEAICCNGREINCPGARSALILGGLCCKTRYWRQPQTTPSGILPLGRARHDGRCSGWLRRRKRTHRRRRAQGPGSEPSRSLLGARSSVLPAIRVALGAHRWRSQGWPCT